MRTVVWNPDSHLTPRWLVGPEIIKQGLDPGKEYSYRKAMATALRRLWQGWKLVGKKIGDFQARVLLTLFYFVILAPFALGVRLLADPLGLKQPGGWHPVTPRDETALQRAGRQF